MIIKLLPCTDFEWIIEVTESSLGISLDTYRNGIMEYPTRSGYVAVSYDENDPVLTRLAGFPTI